MCHEQPRSDRDLEFATTNDEGWRERVSNLPQDVKKGSLTPVFESSAQRCDVGATELEAQIRKLGGEPATSGSVGGTLHRRWTDIMSSVTGMEEHVVLEECERGEDAAMRHYEAALKEDLPADIEAIVRRQYVGVKANHDRIQALRD